MNLPEYLATLSGEAGRLFAGAPLLGHVEYTIKSITPPIEYFSTSGCRREWCIFSSPNNPTGVSTWDLESVATALQQRNHPEECSLYANNGTYHLSRHYPSR